MNQSETNSNILIVGAGAVGITLGYHLKLAKANITFLVRPGKKANFPSTLKLYSYDDKTLNEFQGFDVSDDINELIGKKYSYIITTLDGKSSRTEEGIILLGKIGDLARNSNSPVIMCGVGHGLREHYLQIMKMSDSMLHRGVSGWTTHQARAEMPIHSSTDLNTIKNADICFKKYKENSDKGFQIEANNVASIKPFVELYNRCKISRCILVKPQMMNIFSTMVFPIYAAFDIMDWQKVSEVVANKELWKLAVRAQREVLSLPKNGFLGKAMAIIFGNLSTAYLHNSLEKNSQPINYQEFNRFHHGGKVRPQNIETLKLSVIEGEASGRKMKSLKKLLEKLEETSN